MGLVRGLALYPLSDFTFNMNKSALVANIYRRCLARETPVSMKFVETLCDDVFNNIEEEVKQNGRFMYSGFGTFSKVKKNAYTARNPRTGEPIEVPEKYSIKFRPAKRLKESFQEKSD